MEKVTQNLDILLLLTFLTAFMGGSWIWYWAAPEVALQAAYWPQSILRMAWVSGLVSSLAFCLSCPFKAQWRFRIHVPILVLFLGLQWYGYQAGKIHYPSLDFHWLVWEGIKNGTLFSFVLLPILLYIGAVLWHGVNDYLLSSFRARVFSLILILVISFLCGEQSNWLDFDM